MSSSDDELTEFHSVFTAEERNSEDFKDLFQLIQHFIIKKFPDDFVTKYFQYRNLLTKEMDTGELGSVIDKVVAENKQLSDDLNAGKAAAAGRLIGMVRKVLPSSNPLEVKKMIEQKFNLQK